MAEDENLVAMAKEAVLRSVLARLEKYPTDANIKELAEAVATIAAVRTGSSDRPSRIR